MTYIPRETSPAAGGGAPQGQSRFRLRAVLLTGLVGALALAYLRGRVIDVVVVVGKSMVPTFADGTRLLAWQGRYKPGELKRGEIVLLYDPTDGTLVVKRVVGLGGDTVAYSGNDSWLDGRPLDEPYVNRDQPPLPQEGQVTVPPDAVFVMGDNRGNSEDSRDYGPVLLRKIRGRPFVALWPASEWGRGQRGLR